MKSLFQNLELIIQTNISKLSNLVQDYHTDLQLDIVSVNETLHESLNNFRTNITQYFKLSSDQNTMTQYFINNLKNETSDKLSMINASINENQLNIKNNFTLTSQILDQVKSQINNVVTNSYFQTEINLLKQQMQNISSSVGQSMTNAQYRCIMIGLYYNNQYQSTGDVWKYGQTMSSQGCTY
ncbi:Hypothetical_protein [Hexamita inflata]|uniref:Hypothetical_protein n=1 Tax=Hexamita inflata TaxID=28002 RepID=A0AA86P759_9EUKA|nr:Hypothetical protein HINF_LOCUS20869 [Hexamita inflata]